MGVRASTFFAVSGRGMRCAIACGFSLCAALTVYAGKPPGSPPPSRSTPTLSSASPTDLPDPIFASSFEVPVDGSIDDDVIPAPDSVHPAGSSVDILLNYQTKLPVRPENVAVRFDTRDITATCSLGERFLSCTPENLLDAGVHTIDVTLDVLHKRWMFQAVDPPTFTEMNPVAGTLLPPASRPAISGHFSDNGSNLDKGSFVLLFDDIDVTSQTVVTLDTPRSGSFQFTPPGALITGSHIAKVSVNSTSGLSAASATNFAIDIVATYRLDVVAPLADAVLLEPEVRVDVTAESNKSVPDAVTVNGHTAFVQSYAAQPWVYTASTPLQPGTNLLAVKVVFADGEVRTSSIPVTYDAPPVVSITTPIDWQSFGPLPGQGKPVPGGATDLTGRVERPVTISGTVSKAVASVMINQQQATLSAGGTQFQFEKFFLHEGTNLITATATDDTQRSGSASITAYVDQTAPLLTIESPRAQAATSAARIDVRGVANDAVEPGVAAPEPVVVVHNEANGSDTTSSVSDRYYLAHGVSLEVGRNHLVVTATDALGNARSNSIDISRIAVGSSRLTALSGDRQSAAVKTQLPNALTVVAFDASGLPLANSPVRFDILRGSGAISTAQGVVQKPDGISAARNLVVNTDASGRAAVWLTLGSEAVESGNMVRAASDSLAEDVVFTATGARGAVALVSVDGASGSQFVASNSQPLEALSAVVQDAERNPLAGMPVEFSIDSGDARFTVQSAPNGDVSADGNSVRVVADKNGVASARPVTGTRAGTVQVRATAVPTPNTRYGGAIFQLMVLAPRAGPTRFGGVVLDHTGAPLQGVRLEIARTALSTISDAQGHFQFDALVPSGKIDLQVDGRPVHVRRSGQDLQYPLIHFETAVVQGQDNQLPHPIYLPPINLALARIVGGDQDVSLTIPGIEGFEMVVKAHSVTFPDGSREGALVVTPVHSDRLPMVPPGASAAFGAVAWTLQPTNTRFDPPIQVKIPNAQGMKPGETAPIVQWDHDLATFVPLGNGTVSEDGTQIVSDTGSGITKAGWGGCTECPPQPPNCGTNPPSVCRGGVCGPCPDCKVLGSSTGQQCPACVRDIANTGKCDNDNACKRCVTGNCEQKYSETVPASVSNATIPAATWSYGAIPAFHNAAAFTYATPASPPDPNGADWGWRLEPYCNHDGKWKFAVAVLEFKTKILIDNSNMRWNDLTPLLIGSWQSQRRYTVCELLDSAEMEVRWSSSTHYVPSGHGNPAVQALLSAGVRTFPAGYGGRDRGKNWNTEGALLEHERIHEARFKIALQAHESEFIQNLKNLETPIVEGDTLDSAGKQAIRARVRTELADLAVEFANQVSAEADLDGGVHARPEEFYNASMGAGSTTAAFATIAQRRATEQCGPPGSRPGSSSTQQRVIWLGAPEYRKH
ncbi:MAG: hypothetical protein ABI411_06225 [Tahibacter sp.]